MSSLFLLATIFSTSLYGSSIVFKFYFHSFTAREMIVGQNVRVNKFATDESISPAHKVGPANLFLGCVIIK